MWTISQPNWRDFSPISSYGNPSPKPRFALHMTHCESKQTSVERCKSTTIFCKGNAAPRDEPGYNTDVAPCSHSHSGRCPAELHESRALAACHEERARVPAPP